MIEHRRTELVQTGVRQLRLRLDTGDLGHPEMRLRPLSRVPQERGLLHPGLTPDNQRGTAAGTHALAEAVQLAELVPPAVELRGVAGHGASIVVVLVSTLFPELPSISVHAR
ncbi:hypothetical protein OWR29_00190 [Actinoplanes sp. Pm04-4]|uniref:Uncharacterized protein n=1 Tax=Paractinoplanes pyxinae TaxID=2997416 RepID=A0ABT4AQE5_9ACTN|nr:hypothetical protein [Actinoplanes pyxinae]